MDTGAWRATVHGVTEHWTRLKWLFVHLKPHHSLLLLLIRQGNYFRFLLYIKKNDKPLAASPPHRIILLWVALGMRLKCSCLLEGASHFMGFPGGSAGKESSCNAGDLGSIPGWARSPGERKGYPLRYSGLENSTDSPWGRKELDTTERLSLHFTRVLWVAGFSDHLIFLWAGHPPGWDWPTFSCAEGTFLSPCSQLDNRALLSWAIAV